MTGHPLDSPLWSALTGPHRELAEVRGAAARYRPEVAPFAAQAGGPGTTDPAAWADLSALAGPGGVVVLSGAEPAPGAGWRLVERIPGLQFEGSGVDAQPDDEAVALGADDVPEMLDLVARTRPGPFRSGTHLMGGYLGIRLGGALIAMAGQRMRPPGWTEISAVCTDPDHRGKGLAGRLVRAVAAGVRARGDVPFLHVAAVNTGAVRLYERLGFTLRREVVFSALRAPE
ncbi:GNAT family N-acetyltransferase [Pseudonocardia humida]|uniref:GNAT family N-acetyltransferase n=1 Tax=Pseudonocardia humida TaxID=2800819 RepID=A0ABT1A9Q3_9PSEU|nr:GNAT family N-acetyltransferase [Pseudonocardia humida]MCO1659660.1 GNAT family N-acetyltransferase [Pseudonocardia humida]